MYGTTSGSLTQVSHATNNNGSFSATLSGLSPNQTYYYKAYVTVSGTGDYANHTETFYGDVCSFTTGATSTVTTGGYSNVTSSSATLSASYANVVTGNYAPQEVWFAYGTSSTNLNKTAYYDGSITSASGSFTVNVESLSANTTYYYKAYMTVWNGSAYVDISGGVQSFKTAAATQTGWQAYLNDYGMPDVSGLGTSLRNSGTVSDRDDKYYGLNTSNNKRQIAIHTYTTGSPNSSETLNYVVLYDGNKYAPVWTYHVMNTTKWPDNNVGRATNNWWGNDPAISLTQQPGLDDADNVGYSRGHLVASNYRQTTAQQNRQTFYYSNQAPQWQNSFNDGVWSSLETAVAAKAPSGTTMMYVVTGVLYEGTTTTKPSGNLNVPIPSHFYKCIMLCEFSGSTITGASGIAFVYTNEAHTGNYYNPSYVTSIDNIESRAGFDFFAGVPANLETTAEANTNVSWFTSLQSNISSVNDYNWGSF